MSRDVFTTPRTRFGNFPPTTTKKLPTAKVQSPIDPAEVPALTTSTNSVPPFDEEPTDAMSNLPTEIGLKIFSHLDSVTAMCLGLTNRKMYTFYLSHHDEKVVLNQYVVIDGEVMPLHRLMKDWGVKGWVYDGYCPGRFVGGTETIIHKREKYRDPTKQKLGIFGSITSTVASIYNGWGQEEVRWRFD